MRFRNLSNKKIPEKLWRSITSCMGLNESLPGAIKDEYMYESCKTLRITINPVRKKPLDREVETGTYTYGYIAFYPCSKCKIGFLTQVFLHEIYHAWLHQYHPKLYNKKDYCDKAELFADAGFLVLGGEIKPKKKCGSYMLNVGQALNRVEQFARYSKSLTRLSNKEILNWHPPIGDK